MRKVKEWIGANDDSAIPPRVKARIFDLFNGHCAICTRPVNGKHAYDHIVPLIAAKNGNRESNLQLLCVSPCHAAKTKRDVAEKSKVANVRQKHVGIKTPRQKIKSRGFAKTEPQRSASRPLERK